MNPEVKKLWVDALRSGKYKQGKRRLSIDGNHCCLGVLCEIATDLGLCKKEVSAGGKVSCSDPHADTFDDDPSVLPPSVVKWAGLFDQDPVVECVPFGQTIYSIYPLSELNDKFDLSFNQIADLIETYL